ncbi:hypothetical protein B0H14DRAFT_3709227 [Mycena olivaceomarginata]|nr:hypothetical protein B0H14DRAFT_3709227 [Mycena olivaceomarginata]
MLSIAEELLTASFALDDSGLNLFADFMADDAIDVMEFCALECIGDEMEPAWDMFLRIVKEDIDCGDDIIAALMHASTSGLSIFLPEPSAWPPSRADPIILPLEMSAKAPPFPQNPRAFAVRLLMRYAYAIGESPMNFIGPTTATQTLDLLKAADRRSDVLFGINDDWIEGEVAASDKVLRHWFQRKWPNKLQCEV